MTRDEWDAIPDEYKTGDPDDGTARRLELVPSRGTCLVPVEVDPPVSCDFCFEFGHTARACPERVLPECGHIMLNLRIDVADADKLVDAGRRSYRRKYAGRTDMDATLSVATPEQAAVELLIEGWRRAELQDLRTNSGADLGADWGDVDSVQFYLRLIGVAP